MPSMRASFARASAADIAPEYALGEFAALLESETVREAIALLFYNVMRKGVNRYAKFHCSTLMDALQSL